MNLNELVFSVISIIVIAALIAFILIWIGKE